MDDTDRKLLQDTVKARSGHTAAQLLQECYGICDGNMHGDSKVIPHVLMDCCVNFQITHVPVSKNNTDRVQ